MPLPSGPNVGVTIDQLPSKLGPEYEGWTVVEGSLQPEKPALATNPNAGLKDPVTGLPQPAQTQVPTGRYQVILQSPDSTTQRPILLTPDLEHSGGKGGAPTLADLQSGKVPLTNVTWKQASAVEDVPKTTTKEQTNAEIDQAKAATEKARVDAQVAAANLEKIKADNDQRAKNDAAGKGALTDDELKTFESRVKDQNLTADQIAIQRDVASNNARNAAVSNQIAAQNAATAAQNGLTEKQALEWRVQYEQTGQDQDKAKFEWQKAQDEIANRNQQAKLELDRITQQQQNQIAAQSNTLRGQELQQRTTSDTAALEQRKAESQQVAETAAQSAALQGASSVYGTERQAQTTAGTIGANVLGDRATAANGMLQNILSGAAGLSQGSSGRYGTLGGGLQGPLPAGLGAGLVSGVMGVTGQAFGGQDTLDAAAHMVRSAAPGAEMTPQGQTAIGVLQQAFERYGQLAQIPHPAVAAVAAAKQSQDANGAVAPVTAAQTQPQPQPQQTFPGLARQTMAFNPPAPANPAYASGGLGPVAAGQFTAPATHPGTAPTIVINA